MMKDINHGIKSNFLSHVLSNEGMGYIHSVFENSFNVIFKETLIHFGKNGEGVSAFGITLPANIIDDFISRIEVNDRVKNQAGKLTVYTRGKIWNINYLYFDSFDCKVPTGKERLEPVFLKSLLAHFQKAGIDERTSLHESERNQILMQKFIEAEWEDIEFQKTFIAHFIGRGIGLTPSGDDMLMGIMIAYYAAYADGDWLSLVEEQLASVRTTDVSMAYYRTLLQGYTSSFFVDFMRAIQQEDLQNWEHLIQNISKYGHTSGWDTLSGIELFYQKMNKENESCQKK